MMSSKLAAHKTKHTKDTKIKSTKFAPVTSVNSSTSMSDMSRPNSRVQCPPLKEKAQTLPPPNLDSVKQMNVIMPGSELRITKPAPDFNAQAVVNGEFKKVALSDYKGKYVVLFFYPLDFTFVCPTEIIAFSDRAKEFREIGCEVIACSTDSHFSHLAWIQTPRKQGGIGDMDIPIIADKNLDISRRYGVLLEEDGIALRGLFIIDDKAVLRQITINDLPVGRSIDETLRLVQAFQYTDKHGEVCPAGWKPGKETITPTVAKSKSFFKKSF